MQLGTPQSKPINSLRTDASKYRQPRLQQDYGLYYSSKQFHASSICAPKLLETQYGATLTSTRNMIDHLFHPSQRSEGGASIAASASTVHPLPKPMALIQFKILNLFSFKSPLFSFATRDNLCLLPAVICRRRPRDVTASRITIVQFGLIPTRL